MSNLATTKKDVLERFNRYRKNIAIEKEQITGRVVGQFCGLGGGAAAAVASRYLPGLVPGDGMSDDAVVWGTAIALDVAALAMGKSDYADEVNYFAAGYGGYLMGKTVEKILP
jgi:hypothetical protein